MKWFFAATLLVAVGCSTSKPADKKPSDNTRSASSKGKDLEHLAYLEIECLTAVYSEMASEWITISLTDDAQRPVYKEALRRCDEAERNALNARKMFLAEHGIPAEDYHKDFRQRHPDVSTLIDDVQLSCKQFAKSQTALAVIEDAKNGTKPDPTRCADDMKKHLENVHSLQLLRRSVR